MFGSVDLLMKMSENLIYKKGGRFGEKQNYFNCRIGICAVRAGRLWTERRGKSNNGQSFYAAAV